MGDKEKFEQPTKEQHPLDREKKEIQRLKKREFEFNELVRTERETSLRSAKKRKKAETKGLSPPQNNNGSGDHQTEDTTTTMTLLRGISKQIDKRKCFFFFFLHTHILSFSFFNAKLCVASHSLTTNLDYLLNSFFSEDEKDEKDEDDDVYSTEGGLYHTYTEALDFPDTAPDEEWQTLQGAPPPHEK